MRSGSWRGSHLPSRRARWASGKGCAPRRSQAKGCVQSMAKLGQSAATGLASRQLSRQRADGGRGVTDRPVHFPVTDRGVVARRELASERPVERGPVDVPRLVRGGQCVDVRGARRVAGGTGGGCGGRILDVARGFVGRPADGAQPRCPPPGLREAPQDLDRLARPGVIGSRSLEQRQHPLCAVDGPQSEESAVFIAYGHLVHPHMVPGRRRGVAGVSPHVVRGRPWCGWGFTTRSWCGVGGAVSLPFHRPLIVPRSPSGTAAASPRLRGTSSSVGRPASLPFHRPRLTFSTPVPRSPAGSQARTRPWAARVGPPLRRPGSPSSKVGAIGQGSPATRACKCSSCQPSACSSALRIVPSRV